MIVLGHGATKDADLGRLSGEAAQLAWRESALWWLLYNDHLGDDLWRLDWVYIGGKRFIWFHRPQRVLDTTVREE